MENISTLSDKFSWRRMMSVGLLYKNPIKLYLIISAVISTACYLSLQWINSLGTNILPFYTLVSLIVAAALYLSPITFTKCDDTLMTLLPAKPSEKWAFYLIYVLVIVPGVLEGIWYALNFIFTLINEDYNLNCLMYERANFDINTLSLSDRIFFFFLSISQSLAIIVTVLLIVLSSQRNRIIKAIVGLVGVIFLSGLLSAISGFVAAIGNLVELDDNIKNPLVVLDLMRPAFVVLYSVFLCYAVYIVWYIYRRISRGQIKA